MQKLQKSANEPRLWPSERIPQGGLFHTPKVEYSKETADLLKCKLWLANFKNVSENIFLIFSINERIKNDHVNAQTNRLSFA